VGLRWIETSGWWVAVDERENQVGEVTKNAHTFRASVAIPGEDNELGEFADLDRAKAEVEKEVARGRTPMWCPICRSAVRPLRAAGAGQVEGAPNWECPKGHAMD
jgi:hypothetical protein